MRITILCLLFLMVFQVLAVSAATPVLPKGYNAWQKSERKIVTDKKSLFYGIHYIYADKKAMKLIIEHHIQELSKELSQKNKKDI